MERPGQIPSAYSQVLDTFRGEGLTAETAIEHALACLAPLVGATPAPDDGWPVRKPERLSERADEQLRSLTKLILNAGEVDRIAAADDILDLSFSATHHSQHHSPSDLNDLLVRIASDGQQHQSSDVWYDPCCGTGAAASAIQRIAGPNAGALFGQDLAPLAVTAARVRAGVSSASIQVEIGDTTAFDAYPDLECDYVVSFPPMGMTKQSAEEDDTPVSGVKKVAPAVLYSALGKLRTGGKAAVLVAPGDFNDGSSAHLTRWLVESGTLQAVIQMPDSLLNDTPMSSVVLVLSRVEESNRPGKLRVVDASSIFADSRRIGTSKSRRLTRQHIDQILELTQGKKQSDRARTVDRSHFGVRKVTYTWPGERGAVGEVEGLTLRADLPAETDPPSVLSGRHRTGAVASVDPVRFQINPTDHVGAHIRQREIFIRRNQIEMTCLAEITAAVETRPLNNDDDEPPSNRVFVNGSGEFSRTPKVPGSKHRTIVIDLLPDYCDPDYVVQFMNSDSGHLLTRKANPERTPRNTSHHRLLLTPLPLPDLQRQRKAVAQRVALDNLRDELDALSAALQNDHHSLEETVHSFEALIREPGLEPWLKTIPYPMSSAIWAYRSMATPPAKEEQLLKSFESAAEFIATILLSAVESDDDLRDQAHEAIREAKLSLTHASFGSWNTINGILGKLFRRMLNAGADDKARCLRAFSTSDESFVAALSNSGLGSHLQQAATWRNTHTGHGGIRSDAVSAPRVTQLEEHLIEFQSLMLNTWKTCTLIQPQAGEYRGGIHHYNARRLSGLSLPFETIQVEVTEPLDADHLYLYFQQDRTALRLLPLVQMGDTPPGSADSVYFFSRLDGDSARLVSYHHQENPEHQVDSDELRRLVQRMTPLAGST